MVGYNLIIVPIWNYTEVYIQLFIADVVFS